MWLIGVVVCLCAAPQVQLFTIAGNGKSRTGYEVDPNVADWPGGISVVLHRKSNRSPSRAMDGRIVLCSIISSCQSAVTPETVKCC